MYDCSLFEIILFEIILFPMLTMLRFINQCIIDAAIII